jgi:hypothetical protein
MWIRIEVGGFGVLKSIYTKLGIPAKLNAQSEGKPNGIPG